MKVLFTGGGTMGSVSPLLAVYEQLKKYSETDFSWIGTTDGPERVVVAEASIDFHTIPGGKLRRYWDWRNLGAPFLVLAGFFKSLWIIWRFKPDIVLTAGSFVSVPPAWAAWIMKCPVVVHQQDLRIGLANRLMQLVASRITVAFEDLIDSFPAEKVVVTGNPIREFLFSGSKQSARQRWNLEADLPVVMVMGGGIGSEVINKTFVQGAEKLTAFCQVIHLMGRGEQVKWLHQPGIEANPRYHAFEFLTEEMADAYAVSDVVVSRAGFSSLSELSALAKPSVIVPIPDNQQEENAAYFASKQSVVLVRQEDLETDYAVTLLEDLLQKEGWRRQLGDAIHRALPQDAAQEYVKLIYDMTGKA